MNEHIAGPDEWTKFLDKVIALNTPLEDGDDGLNTPNTFADVLSTFQVQVNHDAGDQSSWGRLTLLYVGDGQVQVTEVYNRNELYFDAVAYETLTLDKAFEVIEAEAITLETYADYLAGVDDLEADTEDVYPIIVHPLTCQV